MNFVFVIHSREHGLIFQGRSCSISSSRRINYSSPAVSLAFLFLAVGTLGARLDSAYYVGGALGLLLVAWVGVAADRGWPFEAYTWHPDIPFFVAYKFFFVICVAFVWGLVCKRAADEQEAAADEPESSSGIPY